MATAGPSKLRSVSDQTSSVFSSKSPSRSSSPGSTLASSVKEASITSGEVKEPEPDLPKALEDFSRVLSVPKALFHMYETYREWHFSFAPTQNLDALSMKLNEEKVLREKAEQQVRDLTQRLSSGVEPGPEIQPSEREPEGPEAEKVPALKRLSIKERDERRRELIENKENKPLEERFEALVDWSDQVQEDYLAAQDRNTLFFDDLGKASKKISKLKAKKKVLQADRARLENNLEQSRKQTASGRDSPLRTEGTKGKGVARQTTIAHDDESSMALSADPPKPPASQIDQENRLAELQRENERLRQENDEMRNTLEQPQNEDGQPDRPESHFNDANPEEIQIRSANPGVDVQGGLVEIGGITTGQDIVAPVMPVTPPATSETEVTLRFDPQRLLNNINRDSRSNSDDARRRRVGLKILLS
ncbi:hypothetical protein ACKRZS_007389 [Fusarium odoratissimum]